MDEAQRGNLSNLPPEIVEHILSYLSLQALLPLCAVSEELQLVALEEVEARHRAVTRLQHQDLCYYLYAPIDRFHLPLVRCDFRNSVYTKEPVSRSHDSYGNYNPLNRFVHEQQADASLWPGNEYSLSSHALRVRKLHSTFTTLRPRPETIRNRIGGHITAAQERRIRLDDEARFGQLIYKVEILQYDAVSPRKCRGSTVVVDGVVRVFRDWLEQSLARQAKHVPTNGADGHEDTRHMSMLQLDDDGMLALRTTVRAGAWNRETDEMTYYITIHDILINSTFLVIKSEQAETKVIDQGAHSKVSTGFHSLMGPSGQPGLLIELADLSARG